MVVLELFMIKKLILFIPITLGLAVLAILFFLLIGAPSVFIRAYKRRRAVAKTSPCGGSFTLQNFYGTSKLYSVRIGGILLGSGVIGNTPAFGAGNSRFDP